VFLIEDEIHSADQGRFATRADALAELKRLALIPWDNEPNLAPCTSWKTCGRDYVVIEYDDSNGGWHELSREMVLRISALGIEWTTKENRGE